MSPLTPETARNAVIETAHDRLAKLRSIAAQGDQTETDIKLATVILVAEVLRDVEALVTEPLLQRKKRELHRALPRVAACKDHGKLPGIIAAFCADANRILPCNRTFDPENPPW